MSKDSEKLKVIFYEAASEGKQSGIIADGYFGFVPTFKEGDAINITIAQRKSGQAAVRNPIGHKTHRVLATDWVVMIDELSKEALATLIVSVSKIDVTPSSTPLADNPTQN
ncbi:hypothetical protein G8759_17015 [Spirosoma aureum]|uniref:Uncharacterized protein n=1 Tax=Spirosoma aureum TaxID=2692134 RepID=A0A6G9APD6_9BACT|nr:hypothetical protein [Spirosoma aureum]QIP14194.1 hypothetical protein G8759_17015 [Spirosoma aureum]